MATASTLDRKTAFLREFIMARGKFDPADFGIEDMERDDFMDLMVEEFNNRFRGQWTIDEVLLHPRDAMAFCDDVRMRHGWLMLPDDVILRSVLTRRKNP